MKFIKLLLVLVLLSVSLNWSVPAYAASADCNIWWTEVAHDTFDSNYRSIVGPTTPGNTVKLRLRVAQSDLTSARVRVWNDRTNSETYYNMAWDGTFDTDPVTYDWWYADIPVGAQPTILYYFFELNDSGGACSPADQDFYTDDDVKFYGGGLGSMSDSYNDQKSYQITVYDPTFNVPSWMQRGVVYQIFPDRFRDGNSGNNPVAGRFSYDRAGGAIVRSNQADWNYTVCDPRGSYSPTCTNYYGDNFYGGDLQGVIDKINDGYFDNLGVTVLYLNPIFRSPSNHKYDTADYLTIDPDFGDLTTFQNLVAAADAHGIKIILDGVFNHVSSDSRYFDIYKRYDASGVLTSPSGVGTDDQSGACESPASTYRSWFYIPDIGTPGNQPTDRCDANDGDDPGGAWTLTYDAWYGYGSLPKLQANTTAVRNLIWSNGLSSVGPYWVDQGASGWRFDVGGDVDPGLTNDPANDYWEGFRSAVRAIDSETVTLGEEWGDGSPWLLGNEWDSVMNYRFRSALLSWLFTGCSGNGCAGGTVLEDNDSNAGSSSGAISYISPSQFNARLMSIWEDYPSPALHAMMNLEGSHDTNRLRFLLKKANNDNDAAAVQRMKEWWIFVYTYPGAPTLYYGDEIGLNHDGVWASSKWEDDPYNRVPFPWPDASGSTYSYDATAQAANLQGFARHISSVRHSYRALQDGAVYHGLVINDAQKLYGFGRVYSTGGTDAQTKTALIALNRDSASHTASFSGLNGAPYYLPDGDVLVDALSGTTYTVSSGSVTVTVNSNWGVILLEQGEIDAPAAVSYLETTGSSPKTLNWLAVTDDVNGEQELATYYQVHGSTTYNFTPNAGTFLGTAYPPAYGSTDNMVTFTDSSPTSSTNYYVICAHNALGVTTPTCTNFLPDGRAYTTSGWKNPTANVATSGGDGNGYETNPTNAYTDDGIFGMDVNSGSGSSSSCTSTQKDNHRFYDYGLTLPTGHVVAGIEVRLDAKVDSTAGAPKICVQLSWNGGTNWTTIKNTTTLSTGEASYILGSLTDTWGTFWDGTKIANGNFIVRVVDVSSSTARDFSLDWVSVRLHSVQPFASVGFANPAAQNAGTGGDGNGYQTNPTNAYTDNGASAVDTNSGTTTSTSCTDAGKDSHIFYNYDLSGVPIGATIKGIELRLDARADSSSGTPKLCVQLSWDGGVNWTTTQSTMNLTAAENSYLVGSMTDTWGRTWSISELASGTFRLRLIMVSSVASRDFYLDWIGVKVYYQ